MQHEFIENKLGKGTQMIRNTQNARAGFTRRQLLLAMSAFSATAALGLSLDVKAMDQATAVSPPWPLWLIEKDGRQVYLMGQTPPRNLAWQDSRIEALVKTCGAIWTETNQIRRKNPKELVLKYGLDQKTPLAERLNESDMQRLKQALDLVKMPIEAIANMRPWLAAFTIESSYFAAMKLVEDGTAERVLLRNAKERNIVHSSEFPAQDDVIQFMGEMSEPEDLQFLQYTLINILRGMAESERIYAAWARGDSTPADRLVLQLKHMQADFYAKHVVTRNRNWLPRFAAMRAEAKPTLVIVGLYHMAGPDSLLTQLKDDGWHVQAI
ncbi:MAG: TraB/GumN family protein [Undibacterium sp.]|nr:TraB/GumN family protein [Undibacterium sp.]